MDSNKKKKIVLIIVLSILLLGSIFLLNKVLDDKKTNEEPIEEPTIAEDLPTKDNTEDKEEIDKEEYYKNLWKENKQKNNDYIGQIVFDSGLIDMPFVCPQNEYSEYCIYYADGSIVSDYENGCESGACTGNDVYLRTDWETMGFHIGGSLFMDYRNTIDDQNIIIYGHHYAKSIDANREMFFTPLEKLLDKENYEENKYIELVLGDEIRYYEIIYVYIFRLDNDDIDNLQYYRTNYDYDYWNNEDPYYSTYINNVENVKLYDTGKSLSTYDRTLTLQTCVENSANEIEIVVAKEILKSDKIVKN